MGGCRSPVVKPASTIALGLLDTQYPPSEEIARHAHYSSEEQYERDYEWSINDPEAFWCEAMGQSISGRLVSRQHHARPPHRSSVAEEYHWHRHWDTPFCRWNFNPNKGNVLSEWFIGARTNMAYNCLDRHVDAGLGSKVAFYYEGNDPDVSSAYTYANVLDQVCRLSNYLKACGVDAGDDVTIYMAHTPQLIMAMLACARIGAVHSVVFGGYSDESLAQRIMETSSRVVITSSTVRRGTVLIDLKALADKACTRCTAQGHSVRRMLVFHHKAYAPRAATAMDPRRDEWWQDVIPLQLPECEPVWVDAEHPLFKLFTSGSTGQPKGMVHSTAGYMVGVGTSFKYTFDHQPEDVYFCTADCGWITGTSYVAYGPMLHATTQVIFEGTPLYPDPGRYWAVVAKYKVSIFYTAPTAIRLLLGLGERFVNLHDRSSLRILGSVGEPINPEAWHFFHDVVGQGRCPVLDTWWQTETGAHMITPLPGVTTLKPGSATKPFFGVVPVLLDDEGVELKGEAEGLLCIKQSWPSIARTIAADHVHFENTYFSRFPGYFFTGDSARRDRDGYYWILGRVDDIVNVSGHRIGTAEVEFALDDHPDCAESAVVGVAHPIKGQGIYAYVVLKSGRRPSAEVERQLEERVKGRIGALAIPDVIQFVPELPRTRSGKILRRVLRKVANGFEEELGDLSTLHNPDVVEFIISTRKLVR